MPLYRYILLPAAALYGLALWLRNKLFDSGLLRSAKFDLPIICVGNIEMGGTGKTPLVIYTVKMLLERGFKVAVLSRGYGRKSKGYQVVGTGPDVEKWGDEAAMIRSRLPDALVVVCENRVEGVKRLLRSDHAPDVIVMDDGYQHRWLTPSLSILVTRASEPFWNGRLFPVGNLRGLRSESARADAIVLNSVGRDHSTDSIDKDAFYTSVKMGEPVHLAGEPVNIDNLHSVFLLSGIADPDRFMRTASSKFKIVDRAVFPDHHWFTQKDLYKLREKLDSFGSSVDALVTTEKDAFRLLEALKKFSFGRLPVLYLPIETVFDSNEKEYENLILNHVRKDK